MDDPNGTLAQLRVGQLTKEVAEYQKTLALYVAKTIVLRSALEEIRDIAQVSEGVEFYAMLANKAITAAQDLKE